jgi:predicted GTPase
MPSRSGVLDERSVDAPQQAAPRRVLILGAAGRDFHNFNTAFRDNPRYEVIGFTAAQIPGVADRVYPAALAGQLYPRGIPIMPESRLEEVCRDRRVDDVVFAYSDVTHDHVMHLGSRALAAGADYLLLGPRHTMLRSQRPVIAVSAVRTGCGKSQIARWLSRLLRARGFRVAALRHPMPYGDLIRERVQRFASLADIAAGECTAEEREEYEPHVAAGNVIFAGVDYAAILAQAELEADIIVWDGGNNDFPFLRPDLHIVIVDALRPENVASHHPGETVLRMADIVVINKVDAAPADAVAQIARQVSAANPNAPILRAASPVVLDDAGAIAGRRVLVVDDGPTLTHGGMAYGAGYAAALDARPAEIVDPRESAAPEIAAVYRSFPHIGNVLPAMGYSPAQIAALRQTVDTSRAEVVVAGTPIDLAALTQVKKPVIRARYEFAEAGTPTLESAIDGFLARLPRGARAEAKT